MASILIMGPAFEAEARRVREHAEKPENVYRPGLGVTPPGDNQAFVLWSGNLKIVFSITEAAGHRFRHMSMSTSRDGMYPQPIAAWTAAHHLGFTGARVEGGLVTEPASSWAFFPDDDEGTLVVQEVCP